MIILQTIGPMFGLLDPSPFVTKMDVLLKMSGVPYESKPGDFRQAPKGKVPFIIEDGVKMGDSTLIRLHLENKYGVNFDKHLSEAEKGIAWAVEKMLEDNLYWALLYSRWMLDENFYKGPANFFNGVPAIIRPLVVAMVRRSVRRNLYGHGFGRHSADEIFTLGNKAIDAVAAVLGDKPYLMGAHKCGADATAFSFVLGILSPLFDSPLRTHTEKHKNLVAYCERMQQEFYPTNVSDLRAAA
jgi:glutathione S-transferase